MGHKRSEDVLKKLKTEQLTECQKTKQIGFSMLKEVKKQIYDAVTISRITWPEQINTWPKFLIAAC
jgi:hypothetical protein